MDHNSIIRLHGSNNFAAKVDLMQRAFDGLLQIDMGLFGTSMQKDNIFDVQKTLLLHRRAESHPRLAPKASGGWDRNSQASQIDRQARSLMSKTKISS